MSDQLGYPAEERADRRKDRRATRFVLATFLIAFVGLLAGLALPGTWLGVGFLLVGLAGMVLALGGIFWQLSLHLRRTAGTIARSRVITAPTEGPPPAPATALRSATALSGYLLLAPNHRSQARNVFVGEMALAVLCAVGAGAGTAEIVGAGLRLSPNVILLLPLVALLSALLLFMGDSGRDLPGILTGPPPWELRMDSQGISGPFYPESRYEVSSTGAVMASRWFHRVQASLPAPNAIPWKLVTVSVINPVDPNDPLRSRIAFAATQVPWWSGGLKISLGFFPSGDLDLGGGLACSIERRQLSTILWRAFQGGSRLFARYDRLSPAGQAAVRAFLGQSDSFLFRSQTRGVPLVLPPPTSEDQIATWFPT